jgi:uncharacterized protein YecT (DUF1311 family)
VKLSILLRLATIFGLSLLTCSYCAGADGAKPTLEEARAEFTKAEKALNQNYEFAKKKLAPRLFDELQKDQREWLHFREELALSASWSVSSGEDRDLKKSPRYFTNLTEITKERIAWIERWIAGDEIASWTGEWRDSSGGYMELVEEGDKLHFTIHVVRGRAAHVGAIAGIAEWNDPIGWFSDKGRERSEPGVTTLVFIARNRKVEVIGAKTEEYAARRASFDGVYIRVGRLVDEDLARMLKAAKTGESSK